MSDQAPKQGGIVTLLQTIAIGAPVLAFMGGAAAGVSLSAEIVLLMYAISSGIVLWAFSAVIQLLRNIDFNTRRVTPPSS